MNRHPRPLVTVGIPVYRGAAHLSETIESVLRQSLEDFELVIVDDRSPDDSLEVIGQFQDPRIRLLRNPENLGAEQNWNRCLEQARGKYFKLLPQDDLLFPDALERQVRILEGDSGQEIALVFGARNIISSGGTTLLRRRRLRKGDGRVPARQLIRESVRCGTNPIGEPGNGLARTSLTSKVGRYDGSIPYVIDLDYWVRLLQYGDAYYLSGPVSAFRISQGSWSIGIGKQQNRDYRLFMHNLLLRHGDFLDRDDMLIGNVRARANNLLRMAFYRVLLRGSD